jgi:1-aminocyclopropane-1-carboxylate deaminase
MGFAADGRGRNVIGIDASRTPARTKAQVLDIAQRTASLVGGKDVADDHIALLTDYAQPGPRRASAAAISAIRLSARLEGTITDAVQEGKSVHRLIDLARKGFFAKGSKVLCAHPGVAPALNGYIDTFRNG